MTLDTLDSIRNSCDVLKAGDSWISPIQLVPSFNWFPHSTGLPFNWYGGQSQIFLEYQIQPPAHHIDTQVTGMVAGSSGGGGANWEQLEPRIAFAVTDVIFIFSVILYTWVR